MLICQQFIIESLIGTTVAGHKEFIGNYDISERFKLVSLPTLFLIVRLAWCCPPSNHPGISIHWEFCSNLPALLANRCLHSDSGAGWWINLCCVFLSLCLSGRWNSVPFVATCILTQSDPRQSAASQPANERKQIDYSDRLQQLIRLVCIQLVRRVEGEYNYSNCSN